MEAEENLTLPFTCVIALQASGNFFLVLIVNLKGPLPLVQHEFGAWWKKRGSRQLKTMQKENYIEHRRNQGSEVAYTSLPLWVQWIGPSYLWIDGKGGPNAERQTTGYQKYEHEANNTGSLSRKYNMYHHSKEISCCFCQIQTLGIRS